MTMNPFAKENRFGGATFTKRNRYKLKDGDNVYRILPAMGDLAEEGRWSVYYNVVFGFKSTDGKHFPFQSPEVFNRKDKKVEVECAATNMIKGLKAQLESAKEAGNKELVAQFAKLVGDYPIMGVYTLNNDHYVNVVDRQGNVGTLELGHKAKLALDAERSRIKAEEGFDVLSADNGRFLNLRRDGKGRDTTVKVTVVKEKIEIKDVGKVDKDIVHVIDQELANRLITHKDGKWVYKEAANLNDLYQTPSAAEVELIVKNADIATGKSAGVDALKKNKPVKEEVVQESVPTGQGTCEGVQATSSVAAQSVTSTNSTVVNLGTATPTVHTGFTSVAQETKAAAAATPAPVQTSAAKVAAMTPEEFMAKFNVNLS